MNRGKRKKTFNNKALQRMVTAAILSGIIVISLFYVVEIHHIKQRSEIILKEFISATTTESEKTFPEVYYISTDELDDESLEDVERELIRYYTEHTKEIPLNKVCHFSHGDFDCYFFAQALSDVDEKNSDVLLVYTDVSFTVNTVKSAAYILIVVMLIIAIFLYYIGKQTVKVLDEKDESIKIFFSNASHELKTPLMAIQGYADGMKDGIVDMDKGCSVIGKETDRMTGLINSILEFSKLDSGMVQPHITQNDIREILYDAIGMIDVAAKKKGIQIVFDLQEPILFNCDEDMLFSVFSNILTNSLRYAEKCISIQAILPKASTHLKVIISNDGELISEEEGVHLFERFYKGKRGQTGIGMALSLEYVKLHGGNISVSVKDNKTVFEVFI